MSRSCYENSIKKFKEEDDEDKIFGIINKNSHFDSKKKQKTAWISQIKILKDQLSEFDEGNILFEYDIPRMGSIIDNVLLIDGTIFVLEFKNQEERNGPIEKEYKQEYISQLENYVYLLENFHYESRNKVIVPILVVTEAESAENEKKFNRKYIFQTQKANKDNLSKIMSETLNYILSNCPNHDKNLDLSNWSKSKYSPTPSILEAAIELYQNHEDKDMKTHGTEDKFLTETQNRIEKIITDTKENGKKSIIFLTGDPGAGKTLVGLNTAIKNSEMVYNEIDFSKDIESSAVFLSGNKPLVEILSEKLADDATKRNKKKQNEIKKEERAKITEKYKEIKKEERAKITEKYKEIEKEECKNLEKEECKIIKEKYKEIKKEERAKITEKYKEIEKRELGEISAQYKKIEKDNYKRIIKAFIQHLYTFRIEAIKDEEAPAEKILIFDEAQRSWDEDATEKFLNERRIKDTLKEKIEDYLGMSEAEFLINYMNRHEDWSVILCLIGEGQEINKGEAGLSEWFNALKKFPNWDIYLNKDNVKSKIDEELEINDEEYLHLRTTLRSLNSPYLPDFLECLLDNKPNEAKEKLENFKDYYPLFITRDLNLAKKWVKDEANTVKALERNEEDGEEPFIRYGLLAESNSMRLRPEGIFLKRKDDTEIISWFLNDEDDIRSSNRLEIAATEFDIQGLEIDYSILAWDGNLRYINGGFEYHKMINSNNTNWTHITDEYEEKYLKNSYRVLLTRARRGMVIFIPEGDEEDKTRKKEFYDGTYNYLKNIGIEEL